MIYLPCYKLLNIFATDTHRLTQTLFNRFAKTNNQQDKRNGMDSIKKAKDKGLKARGFIIAADGCRQSSIDLIDDRLPCPAGII